MDHSYAVHKGKQTDEAGNSTAGFYLLFVFSAATDTQERFSASFFSSFARMAAAVGGTGGGAGQQNPHLAEATLEMSMASSQAVDSSE